MAQRWIYRYEVKGIQPYILATDKLREMQGASSLIEAIGELFGEARSAFGLQGARLLSMPTAGGGSLEVEDGQRSRIETLMSAWPLLVSRHAPGLQVVQAMVPQGEGAWDALHDELRRDRSRVDPELPEAGPMVLRAPRTGLPACGRKDTYVDPAGLRKLEAAAEDRLAKRLGRGGWLEDLDRIGHPYVGVVHLDGNDMGQHLRRLGHGDLLAFSEGLERATLATVQAAVEETLREPGDSVTLPARPIVVGGDDVTFIVRGDLALP
ncbi:MAG TPA: hypothetical protein P5076_21440, partial [Myxococcota bacterium]|nr:hypothetical protein [Myxococcota bacterium]